MASLLFRIWLVAVGVVALCGRSPAQIITAEPQSAVVTSGQPASFTVQASGSGALTYQWRRNGFTLAGATLASYTIPAATRSDADYYDVVVGSGAAQTVSHPARLDVAPTSYASTVVPDPQWDLKPVVIGGAVRALLPLPEGGFLVGGDFSGIGASASAGVFRMNAENNYDAGMTAPDNDGAVLAIARQVDGKLIIGGEFVHVGGVRVNRIARLNADGSLDRSFLGGGVDATVRTIAVQPDGKILVGGRFILADGVTRRALARFDVDGRLDATFDPALTSDSPIAASVSQLRLLGDGRLLVGGRFSHVGGAAQRNLAIITTAGSNDATFNPGAASTNGTVTAFEIDAANRVIAVGSFTRYNGKVALGVVRFALDGTHDATFSEGLIVTGGGLSDVVVLPGGRYLLVGNFTVTIDTTTTRRHLVRLLENGTVDLSFAPDVPDNGFETAFVRGDGRIVLGGPIKSANGGGLTILLSEGSALGFAQPSLPKRDVIAAAAHAPGGHIIVGGSFIGLRHLSARRLARLNQFGYADIFFNEGGFGPESGGARVNAIAVQPDGKILIAGDFTIYNNVARGSIARLHADGTLDPAFAPAGGLNVFGGGATALALLPGGRVLVAGGFDRVNGVARNRLAVLRADGSLDPSFDPKAGPDDPVWAVAAQPDGKVLIAGTFFRYDGTIRPRIARLNADGSLDASFNAGDSPGASQVSAIKLLSNGHIVIGGSFGTLGGVAHSGLARLQSDGSLDPAFTPPLGLGNVTELLVQENGQIVVQGGFSAGLDPSGSGLARINADGSPDPTLVTGGFDAQSVTSATLLMRDDGQLFTGIYATKTDPKPIVSPSYSVRPLVRAGQSFTLSVTAQSASAVTYQWMRNGRPISGATAASYTIANAVPTRDRGRYQVVVSNAGGSTSSPVTFVNVVVNSARVAVEGSSTHGQTAVPADLDQVAAIAAGGSHTLVLKPEGTVTGWGRNDHGQSSAPAGLTGVVALAGGGLHSLALRFDGTVVAWGYNGLGQASVPPGLSGVVAIAAGDSFSLALKSNGNVVAWGSNDGGATNVPAGLGNVAGIAAGAFHGLAHKVDGSVVAWGGNSNGQATVPANLDNVTSLAGGVAHSLALKGDGTVVGWGATTYLGHDLVVPSGLSQIVNVVAGFVHSVALKSDGTTVGWGSNQWSQLTAPIGARIVGVASGSSHVAYLRDESVVITTQPQSTHVAAGAAATLSVSATGVSALSYQWRRNGVAIVGATQASFTIAAATRADSDNYDVVVSTGGGSIVSKPASLHVPATSFPGIVGADPAFAVQVEAKDAWVSKLVVAADGRAYLAGEFVRVNGVATSGVARLKADLTIDAGFVAPLFEGEVSAIAVQPDGKIIAVGRFVRVAGQEGSFVTRLNTDGRRDTTFNFNAVSAALNGVNSVAVLPDGGIAIGSDTVMMRLNASGARDAAFNPGVGGVHVIVPLASGKILVAGSFTMVGGTSRARIARLNADGTLDLSFGGAAGVNGAIRTVVPLADGKILIGGWFNAFAGVTIPSYARLNADGSLDPTFTSAGNTYTGAAIEAIVVSGSGKILVGGSGAGSGGTGLARLNSDGSLDALLSPPAQRHPDAYGGAAVITSMASLPDGSLLVGGGFSHLGNAARHVIARVNGDGTLAGPISSEIYRRGIVSSILPDTTGRVLVGGFFHAINGAPAQGLARLKADGTIDPSFAFSAGTASIVEEVLRLPDGRLLVRGSYSAAVGESVGVVARVSKDGVRDGAFAPNPAANFRPISMAIAPGGNLLIAGPVRLDAATVHHRVFRVKPDGSNDTSFDAGIGTGTSGYVTALAAQPDGKVLVIGEFSTFGGAACNDIVRLNADGLVDGTFRSGTGFGGAAPRRLQAKGLGWLTIGGGFSSYAGAPASKVVVLQPDGARDLFFRAPANLFSNGIDGIEVQDDGAVFAWQYGTSYWDPAGINLNEPRIVRLKRIVSPGDGEVDPLFQLVGVRPTDRIEAVALGDDGKLFFALLNTGGLYRTAPVALPVIVAQPANRTVAIDGTVTLAVTASGVPAPTYQWFKDDVALVGATDATLRLVGVQASAAGLYRVVVTNTAGSVSSATARVGVLPAGVTATQDLTETDYVPGGTISITNTFAYTGTAPGLVWEVLLPAGWSLAASANDQGAVKPAIGSTALLVWDWAVAPPSPVAFSYTLNVSPGTQGIHALAALVTLRVGDAPIMFLAQPDPLVVQPHSHAADTNRDFEISLLELTRVIELYNTRHGTVRTGAYRVDAANPEDGFAADASRAGGIAATLTRYHSADTRGATTGSPRDGALDLFELTRVIELYNTRAGTVRTGRYHVQSDTEDGFAAGP